jgi:choline dehydrogenase-like flavoprotein
MAAVRSHHADIVIVGAGIAGALVAWRLARAGLRVLVLEAGSWVDRAEAVRHYHESPLKTPDAPYPPLAWAPRPTVLDLRNGHYVQDGPATFGSTYERRVGGSTWHWLGAVLRFLPDDFRLHSRHGRGLDWPLDYATLEPWYQQAEEELGVAGDPDDDLDSPRSGPYPLPPIPPSVLDQRIAAAVAPLGLRVRSTPQARNSVPHGKRPACCGSSTCVPICPVGAKYDAAVHVRMAQQAGAEILTEAVAHRIDVDSAGLVSGIAFLRPDGSEELAQGRRYLLAAHAVETPRLLLMSRSERLPAGVANSSDQVGRNLMDHPAQVSLALAEQPVWPYRGPGEISGLEHMRDGSFRAQHAAFRVPIGNDGWSFGGETPVSLAPLLQARGLRGAELRAALKHYGQRQLRLAALLEQLPQPDNRVQLAEQRDALGLPRPRLTYALDDYVLAGSAAARRLADQVFTALGVSERRHVDELFGAGHIMGTTRMGADPRSSVTDSWGRCHDHRNLYIAGSSLFPTGGTANPTLTLAALALRTAAQLQTELVSGG